MPPGVRVSDIPGNRRSDFEDEDQEDPTCPQCDGSGEVEVDKDGEPIRLTCPKCCGGGTLW